jgi:hypothetical protein
MSKTPRMVRQITVRPPIMPPIMAPMGVDFRPGGVGVGFVVDDGNMFDKVLELGVRGVDVGVADPVDCKEVWLAEYVLRAELEVDVVVASTVFGTAKRLSVAALSPQAM